MKLTSTMRDALDEARRGPLRRVHDDRPGKPAWPAPAVTLHALVRHGLLVVGRVRNAKGWHVDTWTITDAGRAALDPAPRTRPDRPQFLSRRGYTSDPRQSIDHDQAPGSTKPTAVEAIVTSTDLAGFAKLARAADAERTAEHHARQLQARARTLRRRLAGDAFKTEHQRRQIAAQLAEVEAELRAVAVVGRLAA